MEADVARGGSDGGGEIWRWGDMEMARYGDGEIWRWMRMDMNGDGGGWR